MLCVYMQEAQAGSNKAHPGTVMPAVLPHHLRHRNLLNSIPPLFYSVQSHSATIGVRMKEALSKKLILGQLVIKIGRCTTPPSLNSPVEMAIIRCPCNKVFFVCFF